MKLQTLLDALPPNMPMKDRVRIERAYEVAAQAHAGQFRASGEPYVQHCLSVAQILAQLHMPADVVIAGLLHDTVEDTPLTPEAIRHDFGPAVAHLVGGVTKLAQLPRVSREGNLPIDRNVESLRKMFLVMNEDVRVVLVKLADRLHNMRTLHFVKPEKQERIARETLEIFAPLANRLGIWQMKWELEDLAFQYTNPAKFGEISSQLAERQGDRERTVKRIIESVKRSMARHGIEGEVTGRPKHIYSIHRKMVRRGITFDEVLDTRAVRILVSDQPACYHMVGLIHSLWKPIPGTFDDYIATPKDTFYQSLHTTVVYDDGKPLEVQIRTAEMHEQAEFGIAAHWRYKEGARRDEAYEKHVQALRSMMAWQQDVADAGEFVDAMKRDVFQDRVYVFTPRGDIIDLPTGATPIDFAYHVHTAVGERCRGAKVNGRLVSLDYRLKTGEQVEILTAKQGGPSRDWLNPDLGLAKSHRALQKIQHYFRRQNREAMVAQGREVLEKELRRLGMENFSHEALAGKLGYDKADDMLYALGTGDIHGKHVAEVVLEEERQEHQLPDVPATAAPRREVATGEISVVGTLGMYTRLAPCCNPLPADPIVGYVTRGRGVTIHRQDCPNMLRQPELERRIKVSWGQHQKTYPVPVRITAYDRPGLMQDISSVLSNEHINMSSLSSQTKGSLATIEMTMDMTDISVLPRILSRIEQLPNVIEAYRPKVR